MDLLLQDYWWVVVLHIVLVFILYFTTVKKPKTIKVAKKAEAILSPIESIKICFKKYFDFKDRARRSEYWWFYLFYNLIFVFSIFISIDYPAISQIGFYSVAFSTLPYVAAKVRRLHDVDMSGGCLFFYLIPFGGYYLLFLNLKKGAKGKNYYGKDPLK